MFQEVWESRPEVGSSRKRRRAGLATSSTPMVSRFLCSTLRPSRMLAYSVRKMRVIKLTSTGHTNDSVGVTFHLQKLQYFFHILIFLLDADSVRLSKNSAEPERFSDSTSFKMKILLLNVAGLSLERDVSLSAVDEHFTGNYTHSNPRGQHIEKSSFARTRNTLIIHTCYLNIAPRRIKELTIRAVKVPGLTHPSTWSKILLGSFLILIS